MAAIRWNGRVPRDKIRRLYEGVAAGVEDMELADDVGCSLYARCESIVRVTVGYEEGRLPCPECGEEMPLGDDGFRCGCGRAVGWAEFRKSYKDRQLYAANAIGVFQAFLDGYPGDSTFGEKIVRIDTLIHSFHYRYSRTKPKRPSPSDDTVVNRPTGANLIEGTLTEVILFLDGLSSIEGYAGGKRAWMGTIGMANGGEVLSRKGHGAK
ncbi:MAG: hypothetical protein FWE70_06075 [Oscillospiraceae bacterium]|nr:hypothetical protein [Oscillospiraceae bacterium]